MTKLAELHKKWVQDLEYRHEYEKLDGEFDILKARAEAHISQEQVAEKLKTSQSAIARLEGGRVSPSIATLQRYAQAVGATLKIQFISNSAKT